MEYRTDDNITKSEADYVEEQLVEFADGVMGPRNHRDFGIALRDADDQVVGGIVGHTIWEWLQIGTLWLPEELRGKGLGHQLLEQAEELGRRRNCKFARLATWEFEAREFYGAHGYAIFGQHSDFPHGHTQYYLAKAL